MDNEIVIGSELTAEQQLAMINEVSKGNYVPRIELIQSNSAARKQGLATDGEYLFNGTDNWGKTFTGVFIAWRPHAIMFDNQGNFVTESFNPESETYKMIKAKEGGPKIPTERPGYGADFLVWCPDKGVYGILPLLKTARRHIKPAYAAFVSKKAVVISSHVAESGGNTWASPLIQEFRGTLDSSKMPSEELTNEALNLFKAVSAEQATETTETTRPR